MKSIAQQMELFADGGLKDEGGMVDNESGNEVPPGALREEVRDDIPANLSEGEFVFPADVVRYWGLSTLMKMRQQAKAGLKRMEDMGQMGNADEAVIPDDLPFTIDDLDMEDEQEYNFAVGGLLAQQGISNPGYTTLPVGTPVGTLGTATTGQAATPVTAASATPATTGAYNPQLQGTQFTPTTTVPGVMPTFQQTVGANVPGVDFEYVEYVNDAGQVIQLRKSKATGELLDPIPEGYKLKTDVVEETTTTPTTVDTAKVAGDSGPERDDGLGTSGARVSWGGTTQGAKKGTKVGGTMVGIQYTKVDPTTGKPVTGLNSVARPDDFVKVIGGLTLGGELPAGYAAQMVLDNVITDLPNQYFNEAKKNGYMGQSADMSLEIARTNVKAANIMQEKYGLRDRTRAMTMDEIGREAARSDKGIAELAEDYKIDFNTIKDNPFGFGKNYEDAVAKAVEEANKNNDPGADPFTADDIKAGHAARTSIAAHNEAVAAQAAAKNEAAAQESRGDDNNDEPTAGPSEGYSQSDYDAGFDTGYD